MIRAIHLLAFTSLTLMFAAAASTRAEAGSLIENFSGAFGPTTTLGGTALGADTNFSFQSTPFLTSSHLTRIRSTLSDGVRP